MERRLKYLVRLKRCRTCVIIVTILVWIIALYYVSGVTSSGQWTISYLFSTRKEFQQLYSATTEELDHTISAIRYKNCLLKYKHDVKRCRGYDVCNRFTNSTVSYGCQKRLPSCLVIGVYKAGTRALVDFLSMHPRVVVRKYPFYELQFFDRNFQRGMDWYKNEMPYSMPDQVTIEKTPSYFQNPESPARIFATNPEMKLILMVRNPIDCAISHFTFESFVSKSRYGGAMRNCILDPWTGKVNKNCFAVKYSVYDEALERYLKYFDHKQILIIEYEEFVENPFSAIKDVERFLQLDSVIQEENFVFNAEKGFYCLREDIKSPVSCYDKTRGRDISVERYRDMGLQLQTYFRPHNQKFFNLIGRNYTWTSPLESHKNQTVLMNNTATISKTTLKSKAAPKLQVKEKTK